MKPIAIIKSQRRSNVNIERYLQFGEQDADTYVETREVVADAAAKGVAIGAGNGGDNIDGWARRGLACRFLDGYRSG